MSGHSKWANIKHRKAKQDAQKGRLFTRLGREIIVAARHGGPNLETNTRLRLAVQRAREANIPNENIMRAIQRATGGMEEVELEELVYEGYGPGGVAVMVDVVTDNRKRTAADMRYIFGKHGGGLGEAGCVSWMFKKKGYLMADRDALGVEEDDLLTIALETGAEDMKIEGNTVEVLTVPEELEQVRKAFEERQLKFAVVEVTMVPQTTVSLQGKQAEQMIKLMDALGEHDDVQRVYANFDIDEAEMERLTG